MGSEAEQPKVRLGPTGGASISAAVFVFVERGELLLVEVQFPRSERSAP
jgi:hypothetical protein